MRIRSVFPLLLMAFVAVGCSSGMTSGSNVKFMVLDMRGKEPGAIRAVHFASESRHVRIPFATYVGSSFAPLIHDVYVGKCVTGGELGPFYCVKDFEAKVSELERLCVSAVGDEDLVVSVTFYMENAFPVTYFITDELYYKVLSSWKLSLMQPADVLSRSMNACPGRCGGVEIDFDAAMSVVKSRDYDMIVLFPGGDFSASVEKYGGEDNLRAASFYRLLGHCFTSQATHEEFVAHLDEHLESWLKYGYLVRIVLW